MADSLSFTVHLDTTYEDALARVEETLKTEGFGILTRIDVKAALKEKIGQEFRPYAILGACNPQLAFQALSHAPEVGLMLPCNITVEQDPAGPESGVIIRIIDPIAMMQSAGMGDDEKLAEVASQAREKLQRVAVSLS